MSKLKTVPSAHGFAATVDRVEEQLAALGVPIFAKIDHADNARSAGLEMPPTIVVVFGAARGGTPAMSARPDIAYELPLRLLIRQGAQGTELLYRPVEDLAAAYDVPADVMAPLHLIEKVAAKAASSD
jgi:uncharacterized protein (DUF302 family)